jgi:hypothetical protein
VAEVPFLSIGAWFMNCSPVGSGPIDFPRNGVIHHPKSR